MPKDYMKAYEPASFAVIADSVASSSSVETTYKAGNYTFPGSHTVTFIHPDLGKETRTVVVRNGETKTAAVKFKQP